MTFGVSYYCFKILCGQLTAVCTQGPWLPPPRSGCPAACSQGLMSQLFSQQLPELPGVEGLHVYHTAHVSLSPLTRP